jgi:hypothetical protein
MKDTKNEDIQIYDGYDQVLLTLDGYPETYDDKKTDHRKRKSNIIGYKP